MNSSNELDPSRSASDFGDNNRVADRKRSRVPPQTEAGR